MPDCGLMVRSLENKLIPESIPAESRELEGGRTTKEVERAPLLLAPQKFDRRHAWRPVG